MYNVLHKTKIPIKLPWTKHFGYQTISNQLFWEFDAWAKSKQTKIYYYIGKKNQNNVKTESTQQTKEIWQVLDSEYATIEAS